MYVTPKVQASKIKIDKWTCIKQVHNKRKRVKKQPTGWQEIFANNIFEMLLHAVYLQGNVDFVRDYLKQEIPKIRLIEPEGTYLLWLDCRELGLSVEELEHLVVDKANLWLDPGFVFGEVGEGFERINIACPRQTLKQAMDQLRDALNAETFLN